MDKKFGIAYTIDGGNPPPLGNSKIINWKRNDSKEIMLWENRDDALEANEYDGWAGYVCEFETSKLNSLDFLDTSNDKEYQSILNELFVGKTIIGVSNKSENVLFIQLSDGSTIEIWADKPKFYPVIGIRK